MRRLQVCVARAEGKPQSREGVATQVQVEQLLNKLLLGAFSNDFSGCSRGWGKESAFRTDDAQRYHQFVERLHEKSAAATGSSWKDAFFGTQVLSLEDHHGFGFAVKAALDQITTDFVLVVQHDQEFIAGFDLHAVLDTMSMHPEIVKYVGLSSALLDFDIQEAFMGAVKVGRFASSR